jgi:hypothetical protein
MIFFCMLESPLRLKIAVSMTPRGWPLIPQLTPAWKLSPFSQKPQAQTSAIAVLSDPHRRHVGFLQRHTPA